MSTVHLVLGVAVIALNAAAGAWGSWLWWRVSPRPEFWPLLRAAQVAIVLQVLLGGALLALDREPGDDLHVLYGLLPVAVSFIAEQLRVGSAESVLELRGLGSAQEVGELPDADQRSIVLQIARREMGVMALSAVTCALLALRAGFTSGGF